MVNFDEEMNKVKAWEIEKGLVDFWDSELLVNGINKIDDNTLEIEAFTNIYLNNDDCYSAQIKFIVKKRE